MLTAVVEITASVGVFLLARSWPRSIARLDPLAVSRRRTAQLEALKVSLHTTAEGLRPQADTIAHMAHHDVLTGLPHRPIFDAQQRLDVGRAADSRRRPPGALGGAHHRSPQRPHRHRRHRGRDRGQHKTGTCC